MPGSIARGLLNKEYSKEICLERMKFTACIDCREHGCCLPSLQAFYWTIDSLTHWGEMLLSSCTSLVTPWSLSAQSQLLAPVMGWDLHEAAFRICSFASQTPPAVIVDGLALQDEGYTLNKPLRLQSHKSAPCYTSNRVILPIVANTEKTFPPQKALCLLVRHL